MTVYTFPAVPAGATWPEPIESVRQRVSAHTTRWPGYKRPDLGLADRLFIGAVVNLPPVRRPWGCITWIREDSSGQVMMALWASATAHTPRRKTSQKGSFPPEDQDLRNLQSRTSATR